MAFSPLYTSPSVFPFNMSSFSGKEGRCGRKHTVVLTESTDSELRVAVFRRSEVSVGSCSLRKHHR